MTIKKKKVTQTWISFTTRDREQKQEEPTDTIVWEGDLKHSRLDKVERNKTITQMKKQDKS